jgi:hypothetical protein
MAAVIGSVSVDIIFYEARVSFDEGRQIKEAKDHNEDSKRFSKKEWEPE